MNNQEIVDVIEFVMADILDFHNQLENSNEPIKSGVRDEGMLESAIHAPFQTFGGKLLIPDKIERAARLCYGITKNHAFIDGNKRSATHSLYCYLAINGLILLDNENMEKYIVMITSNEMSLEAFTEWIRNNVVAIDDARLDECDYIDELKRIFNKT